MLRRNVYYTNGTIYLERRGGRSITRLARSFWLTYYRITCVCVRVCGVYSLALRACVCEPAERTQTDCSRLSGQQSLSVSLCLRSCLLSPLVRLHFCDNSLSSEDDAAACMGNALLPALSVEIANSQTLCVYISVKHMMRVVKKSQVWFSFFSVSVCAFICR